ncbi:P49 [Rachiplusia nu nucleopolyhedrovirus]|uniref:P49 n=1 Tax=Rachiplusia nu nucleopolyhedrovirus TaxID=2605775 RepID=A0AAE6M7G4_9ABAC|nr:P49 [Rachiplusia nu nucleopolyhedrovirus]QEI03580.1 P49 [Rachiplusia nu nucleopolyhedrovirus]
MSLVNDRQSLERKYFKYLFVATYFDLNNYDYLPTEAMAFISDYLRNRFENLNDATLVQYINYLSSINLKNLVVDNSPDVYKYVKPQFKFICNRNNVDIIEFDVKVYVKPKVPVYATNLFVKNPKQLRLILYQEFSKVFNDRHFVNYGDSHCIIDGSEGYLFEDAYVDWCGVTMCSVPKVEPSNYPYRLYLIGEAMAQHFIRNNIEILAGADYVLKNFHKGLPLFRNNYRVINSKLFESRKPNKVFDEIKLELDTHTNFIKFIQRDYIYDANFPDDLLDVLNDYMTYTSLYKFITKFIDPGMRIGNSYSEIVVDRYAVNKYRKLNIKSEPNTLFPSLRHNEPSYIFVRSDIKQIKGTLNAFFVPKERLLVVLAQNSLFGATEVIHFEKPKNTLPGLLSFDKRLVPYRQFSPPQVLALDTYIISDKQKLYLTKHIFGNTVPAYLIIRGDYESSQFQTLNNLTNAWVKNTILKLFL